jgi:pimeloyl-ACP methyl ester carboxylesterase
MIGGPQQSLGQLSRLVLIPGLGVDARFLHHQRAAFADLVVPEWLEPEPREPLSHYAERMAGIVLATVRDHPVVVGGVSLGGMLALEMSRHLNARAVVLIGSCRHPSAISPLLHLGERAGRLLPSPLISWSRRFGPLVLGRGGRIPLPTEDRRLLAAMVRSVSVPLLRWGSRAIFEWPGTDPRVPVRHIHGECDWVIPVSRLQPPPDRVVPGGSHIVNMSHPHEVNAFLRTIVVEN